MGVMDIFLRRTTGRGFTSIHDLVKDVNSRVYYGGIRHLVKATIKRFVEYCQSRNIPRHDRNFTVRYQNEYPRVRSACRFDGHYHRDVPLFDGVLHIEVPSQRSQVSSCRL